MDNALLQVDICRRFSVDPIIPGNEETVGLAIQTLGGSPINGLRHQPEGRSCGWYIWCGEEMGEADDFFQPLHVAHLDSYLPVLVPYLGLPPGWRFLLADGYEDVWFDGNLLS